MGEPEHVDSGAAEHGQPGNTEAVFAPGRGGGVVAQVLQLRLADPEGGHSQVNSESKLTTYRG